MYTSSKILSYDVLGTHENLEICTKIGKRKDRYEIFIKDGSLIRQYTEVEKPIVALVLREINCPHAC